MQKIKFFKSHVMLLEEKSKGVLQIAQMMERAKIEYNDTLNLIAEELGVPTKDFQKWRVSKDRLTLEKFKKGDENGKKA